MHNTRKKKGGAFSNETNQLTHLPLVKGIDHCILSDDIDEKYIVDQDTRERREPGFLKFLLACHGGNPGGKPNKSVSKRRKYDDPTFETSYLNIFRFGKCLENAESSVMCSEKVSDYKKIMDKVRTGLYDQCIFETEVIDEESPRQKSRKVQGVPKTRRFTHFLLSNWNETIDSTAGLYLYDGTELKSRLIPILMFDNTKRHLMDLHQVSMFIELYFGDSFLYTVMCRDYIGPNEARANRSRKREPINISKILHSSSAVFTGKNENDL